jgi:hypothetical protein
VHKLMFGKSIEVHEGPSDRHRPLNIAQISIGLR